MSSILSKNLDNLLSKVDTIYENRLISANHFVFSEIIKEKQGNQNFLLIVANEQEAEKLSLILPFLLPDKQILHFPEPKINDKNTATIRLNIISQIQRLTNYVLILSFENYCLAAPSLDKIKENSLLINNKTKIDTNNIALHLANMGYLRVSNVYEAGEFAIRGSIIDVYNMHDNKCYRVDCFGEEIDSIKYFDPSTQLSMEHVKSFNVMPISDRELLPGAGVSILTYLQSYDVIVDGSINEFHHEYEAKYHENLYLQHQIPNEVAISIVTPYSHTCADQVFHTKPCEYFFNHERNSINFDKFKNFISSYEGNAIIFAQSYHSMQRIVSFFGHHNIKLEQISNISQIHSKNRLYITAFYQEDSFLFNNTAIISEKHLFAKTLQVSFKKKDLSKFERFFEESFTFQKDDLVVHNDYGIGRFEAIMNLTIGEIKKDYAKIIYAGDDKLFLPVENIDLLTKFGSSETKDLDKLGSVGFKQRKAQMKKKITEIAHKLIAIAAKRKLSKAKIFDEQSEFYDSFCTKFPYVETEDQLSAITDILEDLKRGYPMDRLICGDVGFGKTEIAMRAVAAIIRNNSKLRSTGDKANQIAVIVPTTVLARQHFHTFTKRFEGFNVNIVQLSRMVSSKMQKLYKQSIKDGNVDIVIGTHALLSKSLIFDNLALAIIDEEQHFGVSHKERIKEIKSGIHLLTLTATPIPRTLHMSLSGIKDLSIIATPPVERQAVITHVVQEKDERVIDGIKRELARGGRVFFVVPRIADIEPNILYLQEFFPANIIAKASSELSSTQLDDVLNKFYDNKYSILVSTSIIESGVDIPFANTIVIARAEMFGLSQLYQLRGRVGRSKTQGHAYIVISKHAAVNPTVNKRIAVLEQLDKLGSGFNLASYDMDMRGYGNLVGNEQSGHIKEIGFELYQSMLQEAIQQVSNHEIFEDNENSLSPEININIDQYIPDDYISDGDTKLSYYRKLAKVKSFDELSILKNELLDRFGNHPLIVCNLFATIGFKVQAIGLNIAKMDANFKNITIRFYKNYFEKSEALLQLMFNNDKVKIHAGNKLTYEINAQTNEEKIQKIEYFLNLLENL